MFENFFKIAVRNIWRNKTFALINAAGLSVGLGFLFLTLGYLWREVNVNSIIRDNDRVMVLKSTWKQPGMGLNFTTLAPIGQALQENYPHLVENAYHHDGISSIVSKGDQHFSEQLQPGDSTFLTVFGFPLLHGDPAKALQQPDALVITASKADKYFGRTDVLGESLTIQSFAGEERDFTITGVLKELPFNTVTNYNNGSNEMFIPASSLRFFGRYEPFYSWQNPYVINYVKVKQGVSAEDLRQPIEQILADNTADNIHTNLEIYATPVNEDYLLLNNGAAKRMMYTIGGIALFILFMAVVNFVNISVSNGMTRLKETGIRKVLGGSKQQIIIQHLTESIVFAVISGVLGLVLYNLSRGAFSQMLGKDIPPLAQFSWYYGVLALGIAAAIGLLGGIYPAFVLSIQPSVQSLKGKLKNIGDKVVLRRALLAMQFTTAIVVFVAAVVVHQQISFFFNSNLGYDKEAVITARTPRDWTEAGVQKMQTARSEFARLPEVAEATFSFEIPDGQSGSISNNLYHASSNVSTAITSTSLYTDEYYANTYGIELAAGQFFDDNGSPANTSAMVLNVTAARELGWEDVNAAIGQKLRLEGNETVFTVRGVVKDFHFNTMHETIRPIFFLHVSNALIYRYLSFKVKPGNLATTIDALQQQWTTLFPDAPFDYAFMDETLASRYQNELQLKQASELATVIALVIVLLGVFGIVLITITRRVKEVGIRTVLGASVRQIIWLFAKEFSWVLLLANVVGWPLAWWLLNSWLAEFAYKVPLGVTPFVATGIVITILTGLVITVLVIKKALANPVESLRME